MCELYLHKLVFYFLFLLFMLGSMCPFISSWSDDVFSYICPNVLSGLSNKVKYFLCKSCIHWSQTFIKNTDGKFTLELVTEAFELETSCLYLSSIIY